jgi:ribokinase
MGKVLVCGSATTDLFLDVESGSVTMDSGGFKTDLICFGCGTKIQIRDLKSRSGGGGINTAIDLSRLKNEVMFLGKLGADHNSTRIFKRLKAERVQVIQTRPSAKESGFSIIIKSADGDRTILTYKGANDDLRWEDYDKKSLRGADWFYFASMVGESYKTVERLSDWAGENGVRTLFNPSSYVVRKGLQYLKKVISASDIFVVNMEEAQITLGLAPNAAQLPQEGVDSILRRLHALGPKVVAITNGPDELYVYDGANRYSAKPYPVKTVDVAGAGDAFSSGFLTGYRVGDDIEHGIRCGLACSYSVVGQAETWVGYRGMKDTDEISRKFERRGHRIRKRVLHE